MSVRSSNPTTRRTVLQSCKYTCPARAYPFADLFNYRLFMHGGHTNHLTDFSWNLNEPWLMASAAEDNMLQIWKVADSIVGKDEADISLDEMGR